MDPASTRESMHSRNSTPAVLPAAIQDAPLADRKTAANLFFCAVVVAFRHGISVKSQVVSTFTNVQDLRTVSAMVKLGKEVE